MRDEGTHNPRALIRKAQHEQTIEDNHDDDCVPDCGRDTLRRHDAARHRTGCTIIGADRIHNLECGFTGRPGLSLIHISEPTSPST